MSALRRFLFSLFFFLPFAGAIPVSATVSNPHADPSSEADYQTEIMTDPTISPAGRLNTVTGGNVAIINQEGASNSSTVVQSGDNNYARQKQTGARNDISLNQQGDNNRSEEQQNGKYNHKIIRQNGNTTETVIIQQVDPAEQSSHP